MAGGRNGVAFTDESLKMGEEAVLGSLVRQ
jgi:hypothetical protein